MVGLIEKRNIDTSNHLALISCYKTYDSFFLVSTNRKSNLHMNLLSYKFIVYFIGESNALDFKPLKVPAVFRLLRPEFREQLKSHSCQVQIPTENGDSSSSSREFR